MNRELIERKIRELEKTARYSHIGFGMDTHIEQIQKCLEINKTDDSCHNKHLVIAIEELSELIKEVTKSLRFPESNNSSMRRTSLEEEIADVCISIEYIKKEFGLSDERIHSIIDIKLERFLKDK